MKIDKNTISLAYELFLGRSPESLEVIKDKLRRLGTLQLIRNEFLSSEEFTQNHFCARDIAIIRNHLGSQFRSNPAPIQVGVDNRTLEELFEIVKEQWTELGNTEPYWSVLTGDDFKTENINANIDRFNLGGEDTVAELKALAKRNNIDIPSKSCFELGCGVGRVTRYLSSEFKNVICADISPGNLKICKSYLSKLDLHNVKTHLFKQPQDINHIPRFDVFFSIIVLQHNPPPVQFYLLNKIFGKINKGGLCYFQIPTHSANYHYSADSHLKGEKFIMDMHCLPMRYIMSLFEKHHFSVLEVLKDSKAGYDLHSHTFLAKKT